MFEWPSGWRLLGPRARLAYALFEQGELDEAIHQAVEAFKPFVRRDALIRAVELEAQLGVRYGRTPEVRRFQEQLILARRSVGRTVGGSLGNAWP